MDKEVLHDIGCFDRQISGAGTVAATSSVFLASRYAADPILGVTEAAYSYGADTDTIASMTGGLLGAVLSDEWLRSSADHVQDSGYLRSVAGGLGKENPSSAANGARCVGPSDVDSIKRAVKDAKPGTSISLPDGRTGRVPAHAPAQHFALVAQFGGRNPHPRQRAVAQQHRQSARIALVGFVAPLHAPFRRQRMRQLRLVAGPLHLVHQPIITPAGLQRDLRAGRQSFEKLTHPLSVVGDSDRFPVLPLLVHRNEQGELLVRIASDKLFHISLQLLSS